MKTCYVGVKHLRQIPSDWEALHLEEIVKKKIVYGIVQAGPYKEQGVPYIRSTDVGSIINIPELLLTTAEIANKYKRSEVTPGDIVFSLRGNVGETSLVPNSLSVANLTQGTARISVSEKFSNRYVRYALATEQVAKRIIAVSKGSTFREITLEDLRKIQIPIPSHEEQKRIANILDCWDRAIDLSEKLIAEKRLRRKGLMRQLLTGKRRLPGSAGKWREVRVGNIFHNRTESARPDLPLVSIAGDRGVIPRDEIDRKDSSNEDKSKYLRICPGDIGYNTMRMWQGVSGLSAIEGIVSPAYTVLTPKQGIDAEFMAILFKFQPVVHLFYRHSQGMVSDTWNLKFRHFAKIKVTIPNEDEQKAIAKVFRTLNRELALLQAKADALREQKKGLMQQLLTGKKRVKV